MIINFFTSTWTVTLLGNCIRLDAWITFNFDYRWCIWYLCFYVLITYSVLRCVVYVILRCGKLSVCLSVPAFASTFHHRLPQCFMRWLETPTVCGSQIFKVIWQISRSHRKKNSETGQINGFRAFSGERMGEGLEIPYAAVSWPPN